MKDLTHYSLLAELFRYPSPELKSCAEKCRAMLESYDHTLLSKLDIFLTNLYDHPLSFQQEYYTATFDVQPITSLDIGYVLFGEDYRRGLFLVNIKKEQIKAGNDCGNELPDHLTNVLTLLPKIREEELAEELICSLLIPAIEGMISGFRNVTNLYQGLLEILLAIMEKDYPSSSFERCDPGRMAKAAVPGNATHESRVMD